MQTKFVGRRAELDQFKDWLRQGQEGNGRVISLAGGPGIGKTRLMAEVAELAERDGSYVLWSQMIEDPVAPPYTAWLLALRVHVQQTDDDTLRADLGTGAEHVADVVPELRERLGIDGARPPADSESAARFQVYDSVTRLLLAIARRKPLVLLLDNLHLADESSLLLFEYYVRQLAGSRSLVIAAYRDGEEASHDAFQQVQSELERTIRSERLELKGLERNDVGQLLRAALDAPPAEELVGAVHARGDGNPLFTNQVGRSLAGRADDSVSSEGPFEIPSSLSEALAARLRALSGAALDVLRHAAILGRDFEIPVLAEVCARDQDEVSELINQAADARIVGFERPGRFRFDHALFREVLYGQLSAAERLRSHRAAADSLSARHRDDVNPPVTRIAYHWFEASRGSSDHAAIDWCYRAGEAASAKRAYGEASTQFERALALLEANETSDPARRFELLSSIAKAQYLAGQSHSADGTWLKAVLLARHEGWKLRLAEAVLDWQYTRALTGLSHLAAVPLHQAALEALPEHSEALRTRLLASMALALRHRGDDHDAITRMNEAVALARNIGDPRVLFDCLIKAFYILPKAYQAPQRLEMIEEAAGLAAQTKSEENVMVSLAALMFPLSYLGRLREVREILSDLEKRTEASRHVFWRQLVAGFKVMLALLDGHWKQASEMAQESVRLGSFRGAAGVEGRFGFQMFALNSARGTLAAIAPLLRKIAVGDSDARTWLPGQIALHHELGQRREAVSALAKLGDLESLTVDDVYETALAYLSEACAWLGDQARCRQLYLQLKPYRGFNLSMQGALMHGPASRYMALLAGALRRDAEARTLFEEALEAVMKMGVPTLRARCQADYAELLLKSDVPADRGRAGHLLREAAASAHSLGMPKLLERTEALAAVGTSESLTARELDVLVLVASGASNKLIAEKLHISLATVATHVRNIFRKTSSRNRTEAVNYARRCALLPPD